MEPNYYPEHDKVSESYEEAKSLANFLQWFKAVYNGAFHVSADKTFVDTRTGKKVSIIERGNNPSFVVEKLEPSFEGVYIATLPAEELINEYFRIDVKRLGVEKEQLKEEVKHKTNYEKEKLIFVGKGPKPLVVDPNGKFTPKDVETLEDNLYLFAPCQNCYRIILKGCLERHNVNGTDLELCRMCLLGVS